MTKENDTRIYPCIKCGKMRTKAEGGTTFTFCDDCWDSEQTKENQLISLSPKFYRNITEKDEKDNRIDELEKELAKANHAKDEALKWYEDACKEIDRLQAKNEELLELLDKANETSRFWMKIAINTAEEKEKQISELKAENEELRSNSCSGLSVSISTKTPDTIRAILDCINKD